MALSLTTAHARLPNKSPATVVLYVRYIAMTLPALCQKAQQGGQDLPALNYMCADASESSLSEADNKALYDIAARLLTAGGVFSLRYKAYDQQ